MNIYLASCRMGFPFSYRYAEIIELIKKLKFKKAFIKIKNKYEKSITHEIEYYEDFPFGKIQKTVGNSIRRPDSKLVRLIETADRTSHENWEEDAGFLCHKKFELALYIKQYLH